MITISNETPTKQVTNDQPINDSSTVSQIINRLRDKNLCLFAYKSNGRFICRIVNSNGIVVSVASRYTLDSAVKLCVGHIRA